MVNLSWIMKKCVPLLITQILCLLMMTSLANSQQKAFAYELKKTWPLANQKGSSVVVKIPMHFWQIESDQRKDLKIELPFKDERGPSGTGIAYFVDVEDVLKEPDWQSSGFPHCGEFTLTRIFEIKSFAMHHELPYTEVELQSGNVYLRLHFAHQSSDIQPLNAEFEKLIVPGTWAQYEGSDYFRKDVFVPQEPKIFTGPMSGLSYGLKLSLMNMACNGQIFGTETYKQQTYFFVTLPSDGTVYNSNKLNSSGRVAEVINERIVTSIKAFKSPAQESGIDGVKFSTSIQYRNFVNESLANRDKLEIYLPLSLILKFADADITSQELIDGSTVLLNGNRIKVVLSEA